jgi:hypothetical protein
MTTENSEYYIKLVSGFDRIDFNFETSSMCLKCYQTASRAMKKSFVKEKTDVVNLTVV